MTEDRIPTPTTTSTASTPYAATPPYAQTASPAALGVTPDARLQAAFLTHSFIWMFAGLLVSAAVATVVQGNERLIEFAYGNLFLLLIAQLALVMGISGAINRISATVALLLFLVYAASVGLTMGLIVAAYSTASVTTAFLSASATFGAAAVYGAVTKRSLAGLGGILFIGLIGLLAAMFLNIFLGSSLLSFGISIVGVVLFTALTAFHVQRIQNGTYAAATGSLEKGAVLGALSLYLDFINLFLFFLRLFGGRS